MLRGLRLRLFLGLLRGLRLRLLLGSGLACGARLRGLGGGVGFRRTASDEEEGDGAGDAREK